MPILIKRLMVLLLAVVCLTLSGCGGAKELDDMSYVLTVGVDHSDEPDKYVFSYRIAIPKIFTGDGGGSDKEKSKIISVKSVSLSESIKELSMAMGREVDLSHASALFISEPVARQGIEPIVSIMLRSPVYRNSMTVLITKQNTREVLEKNSAPFELFQYRWIDSLLQSQDFIASYNLKDIRAFYKNMRTPEGAIVTGLGAVNENTLERSAIPPLPKHTVPQFQPGTLPRSGGTEIMVAGSAIFRDWKMVGSLNSSEAMGAILLERGINTVLGIRDPLQKDFNLSVSIRTAKPAIDVKLTDKQQMVIHVVLPVECQIEEQTTKVNYHVEKYKEAFEQQVALALQSTMYAYFAATKPLGADCLRLADYYRYRCASYQEWAALDWPELYKNAQVNVAVEAKLQRIGLMGRYAEEGEGI